MRAELYACEWLEDPEYGTMPVRVSCTRALWVPDAGLLFQWPLPKGTVQVTRRESFPPEPEAARVAHLGTRIVPYAIVQEARKYIEHQAQRQAQQAVIQQAMNRLTDASVRFEGRLQSMFTKADLRL